MPRILLVKTSSMGDVIHNFPVIADIRKHYPQAIFDWVVEESFSEIPKLHPHVNRVIPVAIRRWRKQPLQSKTWHDMAAFRGQLKSEQYDYILDTQGLIKSAIISTLANGQRYGHDSHSAREPLAARFYQHCYAVPRNQHAVTRNRELAALALNYALPDAPADYGLQANAGNLENIRESNGLELAFTFLTTPYVVALHATSRDSKLWPIERWIELGQFLSTQGQVLVLPWASNSELDRAKAIAQSVPRALVLPKLGLTALANIIAGASAVIGVDTGLVHLAVALKRPTVAIYTDTDPSLTGIHPGSDSLAFNIGCKAMPPSSSEVIALISSLLP